MGALRKAVIVTCAGLVGMLPHGPANAAEFGFYVGGQYGNASKEVEISLLNSYAVGLGGEFGFTTSQLTSTLDKKDSNYGFIAGYRMLPNLAFEAAYLDLGKVRYRSDAVGLYEEETDPAMFNSTVNATSSGIAITALGILPLSYRWEVYARGGFIIMSNDFDVYVTDGTSFARGGTTENSTDLLAGAGISFSFAEIYQARVEYQRVFDAGDRDTIEGDVDMISLGITVTF